MSYLRVLFINMFDDSVKVICVCWVLYIKSPIFLYRQEQIMMLFYQVVQKQPFKSLSREKGHFSTCRGENTVHPFSTFHLKISKCFEEIKDGKKPVPVTAYDVTLQT